MLTEKQLNFARNYVTAERNASKAYRWSYSAENMAPETIKNEASRLLQNPEIVAEIDKLTNRVSEKAVFTAADWLQHNVDIAIADPNELIRTRRICCRHCYGIAGAWQWRDETEFIDALNAAFVATARAEKYGDEAPPMPSKDGGYGFDASRPPEPSCVRCAGDGEWDVFIADSGKLEGPARRLYAGVKQTRNGVEILMRSQDTALKNIGMFYGLNNLQRHELTGANGGPIITAQSLSDDHLAQIVLNGANPSSGDAK